MNSLSIFSEYNQFKELYALAKICIFGPLQYTYFIQFQSSFIFYEKNQLCAYYIHSYWSIRFDFNWTVFVHLWNVH